MNSCIEHTLRSLRWPEPQSLKLTPVPVGLDSVAVLQPVTPRAFVPGGGVEALAHTVAPLQPVTPLSPVKPPTLGLHTEPVPLALRPVALVRVAAGPRVNADRLEAVAPRTRVLALALGAGADAVPVGFAVRPASAVRSAIVEVEPAARHSASNNKTNRARLGAWCRYSADQAWGFVIKRWIMRKRCLENGENLVSARIWLDVGGRERARTPEAARAVSAVSRFMILSLPPERERGGEEQRRPKVVVRGDSSTNRFFFAFKWFFLSESSLENRFSPLMIFFFKSLKNWS